MVLSLYLWNLVWIDRVHGWYRRQLFRCLLSAIGSRQWEQQRTHFVRLSVNSQQHHSKVLVDIHTAPSASADSCAPSVCLRSMQVRAGCNRCLDQQPQHVTHDKPAPGRLPPDTKPGTQVGNQGVAGEAQRQQKLRQAQQLRLQQQSEYYLVGSGIGPIVVVAAKCRIHSHLRLSGSSCPMTACILIPRQLIDLHICAALVHHAGSLAAIQSFCKVRDVYSGQTSQSEYILRSMMIRQCTAEVVRCLRAQFVSLASSKTIASSKSFRGLQLPQFKAHQQIPPTSTYWTWNGPMHQVTRPSQTPKPPNECEHSQYFRTAVLLLSGAACGTLCLVTRKESTVA